MNKYFLSLLIILCIGLTHCASRSLGNHPSAMSNQIQQALPQYAKLTQQPWPLIHNSQPLKLGMQKPVIAQIRHRLDLLGDLKSHTQAHSLFDWSLEQAVKIYQWRHGLNPNGIIGQQTLQALNVPPKTRLRQLQQSIAKWNQFPDQVGSEYIRINIPSYTLDLVKDGRRIINMKVVVGKPSRETPLLFSKIKTIVFNPKWNVPEKITNEDILPKLLKDPEYLQNHNFTIYKDWSSNDIVDPNSIDWQQAQLEKFPYRLSQKPGISNALGKIKFIFPNNEDIYMHDTNHKSLFSRIKRAYSSGCIRLERPFELAEYFLQNNQEMSIDKVNNILHSNKTTYVKIKNPIPIHITYITAWVDKQGRPHFREDIYRREF